eukprot:COSAG02_NODE_2537_length_8579_cov_3.590802_3_plen_302_part_00
MMGSTLPDVQQRVAAAAARLNSAESEADFLAAAELFEAALDLDSGCEPATYGLEQAQKGRAMQRVAAAAARLNSAESEADFLAAAELFEAALDLDSGYEPATYGLEQAQKGREMLAQQQREESKTSRWSLRAGRSAVAGFGMLREGAQRSIAELSELASTDRTGTGTMNGADLVPEPEPEPEPQLELETERGDPSIVVATKGCQETVVPPPAIIEDARVETFLSKMDSLMQELDQNDDELVIEGGNDATCTATAGSAKEDAVVLPPLVPESDGPLAPATGHRPQKEEADESEGRLRAKVIE